jgi:hypothetical protein
VRPHLKYLRYVLLHKFYVLRAGLAIRKVIGDTGKEVFVAWLWRLLVHDLSKFGRAEWSPYVANFYGPGALDVAEAKMRRENEERIDMGGTPYSDAEFREGASMLRATIERDRKAAFNAAWLHHIHVNPHHWQHHILHEDSGKVLVLVPDAVLVFEMVADWLGAGPKALRAHSMAEAVAETIVWYAGNHRQMQMRTIVKDTAESILLALSAHYGVSDAAQEIESAARARASITIPGR